MRVYLIVILFFTIIGSSMAQDIEGLNKIWVSPYLDYLDLRQNDTAYFDYGIGYLEKHILERVDSVIKLIKYHRYMGIKEPRKVVKSYKVVKITSDSLFIHPQTKYSKVFIENTDKSYITKFHVNSDYVELYESDIYSFVSESTLHDSTLRFNGLYFSSSTCYGSCPSMEFEIDSLGNINFEGRMNTGKFKGNFLGKLTNEQLDSFIDLLKSSALDYMPEQLVGGIDFPNYNLIILYNGKRKEIKGGHRYPFFNKPLYKFLLSIYKVTEMKKTKEIEFKFKTE